jgi:CDP-diacylglycerol---glycerol-3-phosphate 3-phosphatidyltransferase
MLDSTRAFWTRYIADPIGRVLLRLGVSPDVVTVVATTTTCAAALWFLPRGELVTGALVLAVFAFFDMIDGAMARLSGRTSRFGAFLDSTMDRLADGAMFGGLVLYYAGPGESGPGTALALYCLVMGSVTSYARARAESLGYDARVGLAGRSDRLVLAAIAAVLGGLLEVPAILLGGLGVLAVASTITVAQRVLAVRRQAGQEELSSA